MQGLKWMFVVLTGIAVTAAFALGYVAIFDHNDTIRRTAVLTASLAGLLAVTAFGITVSEYNKEQLYKQMKNRIGYLATTKEAVDTTTQSIIKKAEIEEMSDAEKVRLRNAVEESLIAHMKEI